MCCLSYSSEAAAASWSLPAFLPTKREVSSSRLKLTALPRTPDSAFSRKLANLPDFNSEKRSMNSPSLTVRFPSTSALSKTAPIASAQGRQAGRGGPRPRRGRGPPRRNPDNPGPRPGFWIGEPRRPRTPAGVGPFPDSRNVRALFLFSF